MAHKKGQGSVKNGRDSVSKRLGVKRFGSELVVAGNIIVRQVTSFAQSIHARKSGKRFWNILAKVSSFPTTSRSSFGKKRSTPRLMVTNSSRTSTSSCLTAFRGT